MLTSYLSFTHNPSVLDPNKRDFFGTEWLVEVFGCFQKNGISEVHIGKCKKEKDLCFSNSISLLL